MALVTREVNQQDHTRMLQLVQEFPEIPDDVVQNTLLKNKGNLQLTRQALEAVSEHYLYQGNQVSSPTSPQSPSRYPLHASHYSSAPGSPNRSRTPSSGTPGTPPMMDPFPKDYVLSTSGRNSPSPRTLQYQNVGNQPKPGQYTNIGNSPQHGNYVSQLHVTMDRQLSRPSSRPSSGADQDGQLINGTNSASSSTGTPTGGTPTRTPTTDMPAPQFTTPPSGGSAYNVIDDFPTENMLSITPTGPLDRVVPVDRGGSNERRGSPADIRYSTNSNYSVGRYPVHNPTSPYQRHPIDRYPYPVERWNGPEHPRDMSGGAGIPIDQRSSHQYHPHPSPHLQHHSLHISQSVPNLEGHVHYSPYLPREHHTPTLRNASSTQNIAFDRDRPLTPAEVHTPEVAISSHVIPPTPHSPARPVSHQRPVSQQRPHSESYDPRGPYRDGTQSLLVFPDRREPKTNERPIPVTAWSKDPCISLPPCVGQEDDEYTQALVLHQRARFEKLLRDLSDERHKLDQYRRQVADMETDLAHKSTQRSPFPTAEQVNKLREEKRQLQIDIECMNREIELHKSQGLVSQAQHNNFYANMSSTGPSGPIPPKLPTQPGTGHMVSPQQLHPSPTLDTDEGQQWSCSSCTFLNHPALDKCECCEMPRI